MASANKLSRADLKAIVKECLIEILRDGLGSDQAFGAPRGQGLPESKTHHPRAVHENRSLGGRTLPTNALVEAVKLNAGGNRLMTNILADTAMTTLQSQLAGEMPSAANGGSTSHGVREQFSGTPEQAFGEETTSRWANLAFMPSSKKIS